MGEVEPFETDGLIMTLGAEPKPRDVTEDKYGLTKTMAPALVNMNEPASLLQFCPSILNQASVGACAQFTAAECDFITLNAAKARDGQVLNAELAHPGFLYELARRIHGWFPQDSGSMVSDGFDLLMRDKPLKSRFQYVDSAAFDYDDSLFINATSIDDLASHRPFYVSEGNAPEQIKQCLDLGWAVAVSMYWHPDYYNPPNGILPEGRAWSPTFGGHAMTIRGYTPDHGGLYATINHWTELWNPAVRQLGFDFRPGEVAIPVSFFQANKNSPVFELRAASPEPVIVVPTPDPLPEPDPEPLPPRPDPQPEPPKPDPGPEPQPSPDDVPTITNVKRKGSRKTISRKTIVIGTKFHPEATLYIDGKQSDAGVGDSGDRFVVRGLESGTRQLLVQNPNGARSALFTYTPKENQ